MQENILNWLSTNANDLMPVYIIASVIGLSLVASFLARIFNGLNLIWAGVGFVFKGLGWAFRRQPKAAPPMQEEFIDSSSDYDVRIFDEDKDTVVEVSGPVATMTERVRRHEFFNRRYNRRVREAVTRLTKAYEARAELVTVAEGDSDWNPTTQWKSSDGKVLNLTEIGDNHLENIIRKIGRGDDVGLGHRVLPLIQERLKAEAKRRNLSV